MPDRDGDDFVAVSREPYVSTIFAHRSNRERLQRAAILAAILVGALLTAFVLNAIGLSSRASAEPLRRTASVSVTPYRAVAPTPSDARLIADAAPERAALAAQAQQEAAANAAAAAAAARVAAARAAAANAARAAASSSSAASSTLNVWTAGFQTEINDCRGGVDVTAHYGTPTVAEHWSCGGSSFPTAAGTVVTITGLDAGTYRVTGVVAVLDASTAHTNDIPRGYSLLFQTCENGDSHSTEFVGLQQVG
jgi:hypothetical protein